MCGIALHFERNEISKNGFYDVEKMLEKTSHRGKDSRCIEEFKSKKNKFNVFLGHNRLSIFDTSDAGKQPFTSINKRFTIIFNGEIYNYKELKNQLINKEGITFRTNCDTEVFLELWSIYGHKCLKKIHGMYSYCILDKEKESLFVGRDPFGIKPLWFYNDKNHYQFCSELKPLLWLRKDGISNCLTQEGLNSYLLLGYVPHTIEFFKGYKQILPGYLYEFNQKGFSKRSISFKEISKPSLNKIKKEINLATQSDVSLGCFLSGGTDSSVIASVVDNSRKVNSYTVDYKANNKSFSMDDINAAKLIASKLHHNHQVIKLDEKEILDNFKLAIKCLSLPVDDTSIASLHAIAKKSNQDGIKVLLSGTGGDEIYGGYLRYFKRRFFRGISSFLRLHTLNLIYNEKLYFIFNNLEKLCSARILLLLFRLLEPGFDTLMAASGSKRFFIYLKNKRNYSLHSLLIKSFKNINKKNLHLESIQKEIIYDSLFYLNDLLLKPFDEILMKYTIEGRPALIPPKLYHSRFEQSFLNNSYQKSKKSLRDILFNKRLSKLIVKNKSGFGAPIKEIVLSNKLEISNSIKNLLSTGLFDENFIREIYSSNDTTTIFRLFALSCWLQK
ncbi:asparagine synthase (glutamine-hydrolyzing) [Prochlorococcus marinus]|uniref:asparagine synthase (glutamine-hydrolyzing) n=1 Tax=Prochlorococcus marinus TaxID=1219 RepID=UPI00019005D2|nr:asparagine synthase (glutamine-hydrolyzing) [Prochlorococcus marinus]EEE39780.1 asn synthetase [Prochlorococcus marinus str. MIT 9202]